MVTKIKENFVQNLTEKLKKIDGLIFTEYQGLKVNELSELRRQLKSVNCEYSIVKNTLTSIALKDMEKDMPSMNFDGPTALVFINGEPVLPIKKLVNFSKQYNKLKIKSGYVLKQQLSFQQITEIAMLPTKEALLAQFVGVLKYQLVRLVTVLNAPIRNLVQVLDLTSKKKKKTIQKK